MLAADVLSCGSTSLRVMPFVGSAGLQPLILSVDGLLSDQETERVVAASGQHMAPSAVTYADKDKGSKEKFRTSTT